MSSNEIIYMVMIKPDTDIFNDFRLWIINEHIHDMLCQDEFLSASVIFFSKGYITLKYNIVKEYYLKKHIKYNSIQMRRKTEAMFSGKLVSKRFVINDCGMRNI